MSAETMEWLNNNTLIGMTDKRGTAWHYRVDLQSAESNHYAGAIPVGDVSRRLFNWDIVRAPMMAQVATDDLSVATGVDSDGQPVIVVPMSDRVAILRSDTHAVLGVFKDSYAEHDYNDWLIGNVSNILGDTLSISSAGLLRGGAQAWIEVSVPETIHDDKTGFSFRSNILAATSLDGSLATTYGRTITATVCDNTMGMALAEMGSQKYKRRHSRHSHTDIDAARNALSIISETADAFTSQLHALAETTVTDKVWFSFLDQIMPMAEDDGKPNRGRTRTENKRNALTAVYRNDNRVSDWTGTALGVVQAVNTYAHHFAEVRGGSDVNAQRALRNMERAVSGKNDETDRTTIAALNKALSGAKAKKIAVTA